MYEHASEPSSAQRSSPSPACVIISQTDRSPRLPSSSRSRNPHTRPYFAALGVPSQYAVKVVMVCVPPPWNLRNFKLSGMLSRDKLPNGNTILRMSRSRTGRRVRKSPDFHVFLDLVLARARCSVGSTSTSSWTWCSLGPGALIGRNSKCEGSFRGP